MIQNEVRYKWEDFGITFSGEPNDRGEVMTTCPRCSSSRSKKNQSQKCLAVNLLSLKWHCNHEPDCGFSGGLKYGEKGTSLYKQVKYKKPFYNQKGLSKEHYTHLVHGRNLDPLVLEMERISSKGKAICFPFIRPFRWKSWDIVDGEIVNVKYRTLDKKMWLEEGAERIVYGIGDLMAVKEMEDRELVIVEGEIDRLSVLTATFQQHKLNNGDVTSDHIPCISVSNGANSMDSIRKLGKHAFAGVRVIIAVDNDEAGKKLEKEIAHSLGKKNCFQVKFPSGCKDPNDVLVKHGKEVLRRLLQNPKPYPIAGIYDVESVEEDIFNLYENGIIGGEKIGWPSLDELYTVKTGFWTLVTGVPSSGKSGLVDHIAIRLAEKGWGFAVCSPENQPVHLHYISLLEKYIGKPFFPGPSERMTIEEAVRGMEFLHNHFHMILPEPKGDGQQSLSLDSILQDAETCIFRYPNLKGLIIDPYNELDHSRPQNQWGKSDSEYISSWISKVRRFARQHDIHIWVIAHPRKMEAELGKDYPIVRPFDIESSRHWWAKGDCILSVWRSLKPDADTSVAVHVQKIKPRYIGKQGKALLDYDKVSSRYLDVNGGSNWQHSHNQKT